MIAMWKIDPDFRFTLKLSYFKNVSLICWAPFFLVGLCYKLCTVDDENEISKFGWYLTGQKFAMECEKWSVEQLGDILPLVLTHIVKEYLTFDLDLIEIQQDSLGLKILPYPPCAVPASFLLPNKPDT